MKLKNKYSKQNIFSNQKFEDQIWYNQQVMTFLNFSQLSKSVFLPNFSGKHFSENQAKFSFYWKVFPSTNFPNGKQTQESLESDFPETILHKTNTAKGKTLSWKLSQIFLWLKLTGKYFPLTEKCFSLTIKYFSLIGKCFPLTNFSNDKQTQESLENGFPETTFRETNMA